VLPEDVVSAERLAASTAGLERVLLTEPPAWVRPFADGRRVQVFQVP
jgi:hypothetical protein